MACNCLETSPLSRDKSFENLEMNELIQSYQCSHLVFIEKEFRGKFFHIALQYLEALQSYMKKFAPGFFSLKKLYVSTSMTESTQC